eukprot:CAMPEP_0184979532 /NCGR_PEP_ID=MMETSP1098-20130426/9789_1 /TAXON_ID=89044 /ORGANISM="Spumella elongata, Strain CCAP 955/1" /LENGTH=390 /DNA_ID=CAMNT_0027502853 /DNA_START=122 /DNA_END=1294 /DNA_ORIENTATION=+
MSDEDICRVLSIQSHVVSGYVGNKAAVFPLQVLGFDVDFINSVHFSTHTGYPHRPRGSVLTGDDLSALSEGLSLNHLLDYDYLLTGYIGSESFLYSILKVLDDIKTVNTNVKYVCDPVLGDNNQYYVPVALVETFKTQLIPRAHMITPNQFEAELLTGIKIQTEEDAVKALIQLHQLGPEIVVLTSAELISETDPTAPPSLHCYVLYPCASQEENISNEKVMNVTRIEVSKLAGSFTGTGDATAALMLAWVHILTQQSAHINSNNTSSKVDGGINSPVSVALLNSLATVKAMLVRSSNIVKKHLENTALSNTDVNNTTTSTMGTTDSSDGSNSSGLDNRTKESPEAAAERVKCKYTRAKELQVVRSKKDIEIPPIAALQSLSIKTWQVRG